MIKFYLNKRIYLEGLHYAGKQIRSPNVVSPCKIGDVSMSIKERIC